MFYFFLWRCDKTRTMASSFFRFLDHTQRRITVGRIPLDEWSARRRDLTTNNTHNKQTSMPPLGFEPTISAGKRPSLSPTCSAPDWEADCTGKMISWWWASRKLETCREWMTTTHENKGYSTSDIVLVIFKQKHFSAVNEPHLIL